MTGYAVSLAGINCQNPAWTILNGDVLWPTRATTRRGRNVTIPTAAGAKPRPRRVDQRTVDLWLSFGGHTDRTGAPHADPEIGLEANLAAFRSLILDAATDPSGQISVSVTGPGPATKTGFVIVESFEAGDGLIDCRATLTVNVPAGQLT